MRTCLLALVLGLTMGPAAFGQSKRTYDGSMNNRLHPDWGMAGGMVVRVTTNGYDDGMGNIMAGESRPNPRMISNMLFDQAASIPDERDLSDYVWVFGQFIDHDITLVPDNPEEAIAIPIPMADPYFDPYATGAQVMYMHRSKYDPATGTEPGNPRMHINDISAWIDGSSVYGSSEERALWLRTGVDGKLKVSAGNLLPFNTTTGRFSDPVDPDAPEMAMGANPAARYFVAGDVRANEQPLLTAMHTLFMREHNRLCDELAASNRWNDEQIYQHARAMVIGMIQAITYEEWLPAMGIQLDPYRGHDVDLMPNIMNVFAVAGYRLGHSLVNGELLRVNRFGSPFAFGSVPLRDAYFEPEYIHLEGGIEPFLRGMALQKQQALDIKVVHDLRNFLFGPPGAGGLDLVALNITRGRERGLADYNTIRSDFGLSRVASIEEVTSDPVLQHDLMTVYGTLDNVDPWVGMLAEDHMPDALCGETICEILKHQFQNLRDGDWYYYEQDEALSAEERAAIKQTRLADVVRRNTDVIGELVTDNVFFVQEKVNTAIAAHSELPAAIENLTVYPNPVQSAYTLQFDAGRDEPVQVQVMNLLGQVVENRTVAAGAGRNIFRFEMSSDHAAGVYVLALRSADAVQTLKLVKQ